MNQACVLHVAKVLSSIRSSNVSTAARLGLRLAWLGVIVESAEVGRADESVGVVGLAGRSPLRFSFCGCVCVCVLVCRRPPVEPVEG